VSFDEFSETAKEIYVDVSASDFRVRNKEATIKRIAILSGLTVGEVEAIRSIQERARMSGLDSNLNRIAIILSAWHTDSDFTGPYGVPLELKLNDKDSVDLEELVHRHIGMVGAKPIIDELISVGAVVETETGWFKVLTRFYMPKGEAPAGMDHLSRSVEDFVTTLDHNATEDDPQKKMFERQIYTAEGIRPEDLPRFKEFATSRAKLLLEEIDNWLSQLDEPTEPAEARTITGLGIYHYIHDQNRQKNQ